MTKMYLFRGSLVGNWQKVKWLMLFCKLFFDFTANCQLIFSNYLQLFATIMNMATQQKNQIKKRNAPEWDLSEARRIVLKLLAPYAASVYLFGSRANGTMTRNSDIDVAVLPEESLPTGLLSKIREKLEDSQIIYNVDLVDLSEVSQKFKEKVIREGLIWKD